MTRSLLEKKNDSRTIRETVEERGIPTSISRDTDADDTGTSSTSMAYLPEPRGSAPNVAYTSETSPVAKS